MSFETISVIGLGYIGLPTAAMFASRKKMVVGVDSNNSVVDVINRGQIHIVEPELEDIVKTAVNAGLFKAVKQPEPADAFLIAVPTPFATNGAAVPEPNLCYIKAAIKAIAPVLKKGDLVILESTSPVGTTEKIAAWLAHLRTDLHFPQHAREQADVNIAYCPERVLPGHVVQELVKNDRLIGGITAMCSSRAEALYKIFVEGECLITNSRTAEMAKLTENSFRDVNIAFANELSLICDTLDIDVWDLIRLSNRHPRVNVLQPGPGVGGHCIAVDPWFIVSSAPDEARLIRTAREINDRKPEWVIEKVYSAIGAFLAANPTRTAADVTLAVYGLAFKPDIDDLRESPAFEIACKLLKAHSGPMMIVEPFIDSLPKPLKHAHLVTYNQASNSDINVLLVDHTSFKNSSVPSGMKIDCRGIW